MAWTDSITGKTALEKMDQTAVEMEQVYAAFATRMIEILDKEERLDKAQRLLNERLDRFDIDRWHADQQNCNASHIKLEAQIAHGKQERTTLEGKLADLRLRLTWVAVATGAAYLFGLVGILTALL